MSASGVTPLMLRHHVGRISNYKSIENRDKEWHHLDAFSSLNNAARDPVVFQSDSSAANILWSMIDVPLLLLCVACITAIFSYSLSSAVSLGNSFRLSFVGKIDEVLPWILYTSWCLLMVCISCFITHTLCPEAVGGGIPEMKTTLSGTIKPVLLSAKLIVAKTLGLLFAIIGGLSVGKEGPFIQIAGAIADNLMRLPLFRYVGLVVK